MNEFRKLTSMIPYFLSKALSLVLYRAFHQNSIPDIVSLRQDGFHSWAGLFHETSLTVPILKIGDCLLQSCDAFLLFPLFRFPYPAKKHRISPCFLLCFFRGFCTCHSIEAFDSAEDIFLHQCRSIAEIVHRFRHDLRALPRQHGQPEDVVSKLSYQRKAVP